MICLPVRLSNVFDPGPHMIGLGYARKRCLPSFPGLPRIYQLYKKAGQHSLDYPLSFLFRYLERLEFLYIYPLIIHPEEKIFFPDQEFLGIT